MNSDTGKVCLTVVACAILFVGLMMFLQWNYTERCKAAFAAGYAESVNYGCPNGFWIKSESQR